MPARLAIHYAVKANPSPELIEILWASGITHFDVASIAEVRAVRKILPEATLCFMHPVKTGSAIREAYFEHGVKTFSLDTLEELDKIVEAIWGAEPKQPAAQSTPRQPESLDPVVTITDSSGKEVARGKMPFG